MALHAFGMETGSNGNALTSGNTGSTSVVNTGASTAEISTSQAAHGTRSAYYVSSSTAAGAYIQVTISGTDVAVRVYYYWDSLPSSDTGVIWLGNGSSQRAHVEVTSAGAIRFRDDSSSAHWNGVVTTSVGTFGEDGWYRIEFRANMATGTARLAAYSLDSDTPVTNMDSGNRTGINFGADSFTSFRTGPKCSTGTTTAVVYVDDWAVDDSASSTFLGPYTETLATPSVTLGSTVHPTTVGGSDGSQAVTWASVPDAASYDAYIAETLTPDQEDFALVDTGVTSPYTFTGLEAGDYAVGIMAKA